MERDQARLGRAERGIDPKRVVESGYDRIARRYLEWWDLKPSAVRTWFLEEVLRRLPAGSDVLELGCGSGLPVGKALAGSHRYVGVDISAVQVELARAHVPGASFLKGDLTTMDWPEESFDGVVSFYSFNHVPIAEQEPSIRRIFGWLRPGG
jgi:SAM-dependent methyltransferase